MQRWKHCLSGSVKPRRSSSFSMRRMSSSASSFCVDGEEGIVCVSACVCMGLGEAFSKQMAVWVRGRIQPVQDPALVQVLPPSPVRS